MVITPDREPGVLFSVLGFGQEKGKDEFGYREEVINLARGIGLGIATKMSRRRGYLGSFAREASADLVAFGRPVIC